MGGELALRIDDLDSPRVKAWATEQAIDDIRWLGIEWDGDPVRQTQHVSLYQAALERLIQADRVYPCVCSRKDIAESQSAPHESPFPWEGLIYPGTCASWQRGDPLPDKPFCWRFRVRDAEIAFDDKMLGRQTCRPAKELGDFPVTTKAGSFAYQLAVVLDDVEQAVDFVVRGNDLIASTFRQIELYEAFAVNPPQYAHVPLVRGPDGRRLAKRHGDTRLSHYRELGISPQRIVGWAAHSAGLTEIETECSASELIAAFDWDKLHREDSFIDPERAFSD
jgi:glutamyl-tRNA synthetase